MCSELQKHIPLESGRVHFRQSFLSDGSKIADIGNEYGATTGRPRRCGWLDLVALKYSAKLNNLTSLCITKLDVLDSFKKLKVCVGYEIEEKEVPFKSRLLHQAKPKYKILNGWPSSVKEAKNFNDLPKEAKKLIEVIEQFTNVPVSLISNGPNRDDLIHR